MGSIRCKCLNSSSRSPGAWSATFTSQKSAVALGSSGKCCSQAFPSSSVLRGCSQGKNLLLRNDWINYKLNNNCDHRWASMSQGAKRLREQLQTPSNLPMTRKMYHPLSLSFTFRNSSRCLILSIQRKKSNSFLVKR